MALIKCKECGEQMSSKAHTCPHCGAKPPSKTSAVTWFVLIVIILGVWLANSTPDKPRATKSSAAAPTKPVSTAKMEPPQLPSWSSFTSSDEMTKEFHAFATSPRIGPTKPMGFPYGDVVAWLAVGCDTKSEWAYLGFTDAPNLNDTDTEDGYNVINTRVRWDESVESTRLTQKWGAKFLHFSNARQIISKIENGNAALLELNWHGEGFQVRDASAARLVRLGVHPRQTYFEFPLRGSSAALANMRASCKQSN